jgi:hypothetical protein
MTPTVLAISVCPCFIREVYYSFVVGVDCACWSVYYCFLRVLIVLVGQLYQDRGVSGVQGWVVGFSEHVTSVDMKISSWNSGFISKFRTTLKLQRISNALCHQLSTSIESEVCCCAGFL